MSVCFPSSNSAGSHAALCLTHDCSKGPVRFLTSSMCWREHWGAGVQGVARGTSKLKKKILVRGSRAGGRLLLLGVLREQEGWDQGGPAVQW